MMDKQKILYAFVGGWLLGRPNKKQKGPLSKVSADTTPGGFVLSGKPGGITTIEINTGNGTMRQVSYTGEGIPVGFMVVSPDKKYLYTAWEGNTYDGRVASGSAVYAYRINYEDGSLTLLNFRSALGSCTNFLALDGDGKHLFVSNHGEYGAVSKVVRNADGKWEVQPRYDDASLAVFPIEADGSIGEASDVQVFSGDDTNPAASWGAKGIGPHLHCVAIDPSEQLVAACDIEFARILLYHFDKENGRLVSCETPEYRFTGLARGARHVLFHPTLPIMAAITDGVVSLRYDAKTGELQETGRVDDATGLSMCFHPNGKFLYLNDGNRIDICRVDAERGAFEKCRSMNVPGGTFSRCISFDPSGTYLFTADVESDNVICFEADPESGMLAYVDVCPDVPGGASIGIVEKEG